MFDRCAERRSDAAWIAARLTDDANLVMWVDHGRCAMVDATQLRWDSVRDVPEGVEMAFLGVDDGIALFAAHVSGGDPEWHWRGLRELGALQAQHELAITAIALDNWLRTHTHCARCGHPTEPAQGGWIRICPSDGSQHFPRTDPAIIVLVVDAADRALLGRQRRWEPGWFSTLAGFIEPGETAEQAVRREVAEEVGVRVGADEHAVRYARSQPWPFPNSLMLGFYATAESTDIVVDGEEIVEARWFDRAQLADACRAGEVRLPPSISVARKLIEGWYGSALPGDWLR